MKSKTFSECRSKRLLPTLVCLLGLPLSLPAQQNKISVQPLQQIVIKRGSTAEQTSTVVVLPGFHVNSDKPTDEFVIPLKLTWNPGPLTAESITYPRPEKIKVGNDTLSVFTGTFPIHTEFKASPQAAAGAGIMTGKIHYQACNNQMCFRPSTLEIKLPVVIQ